jgi:hypothetical protein
MNWLRLSLLAQAVLAVYFQAIQWLPLGRWNYQPEPAGHGPFSNVPLLTLAREGRLTPAPVLIVVSFALPFAIFAFAYARRLRWLMWLYVGGYAAWSAIEMSWWVRYAVGYSESQVDRYQRAFGQATQLLPAFGNHLPPDGAHTVLHLLLICVIASAMLGLFETAPSRVSPT